MYTLDSNDNSNDVVVGVGGAAGDATKVDMEAWDRDMRINVTSMVLMSRHAIPEMRKNGRGAIVNISSVSGRKSKQPHSTSITYADSTSVLGGNPGLLYPTTKGAIIQMTRAMAAHHGKEGIRVNCVCPGMVFTPSKYINVQKGNSNLVVATWSLIWGHRHSFTHGRLCLRHLLTHLPITFSGSVARNRRPVASSSHRPESHGQRGDRLGCWLW